MGRDVNGQREGALAILCVDYSRVFEEAKRNDDFSLDVKPSDSLRRASFKSSRQDIG